MYPLSGELAGSGRVEKQGDGQQCRMGRRDDPEQLVAGFGGGLQFLDDAAGNDARQVAVGLAEVDVVETDPGQAVADGLALDLVERAVFAGQGDELVAQCRGAAQQLAQTSLLGNEGAHQTGDPVTDQWQQLVVEQAVEHETERDLVGQNEVDGRQGQAAEEQGGSPRLFPGRRSPATTGIVAEQVERDEEADGRQQQTAARNQNPAQERGAGDFCVKLELFHQPSGEKEHAASLGSTAPGSFVMMRLSFYIVNDAI